MQRPSQQRLTEESNMDSSANHAIAVIREQFLRLDPDEQRILRRILRQAQRLDAALSDLHLFLPVIEICFYGVRSGGNTGHSLSVRSLRKLIRQWDAANREERPEKSSQPARPAETHSVPDGQRTT